MPFQTWHATGLLAGSRLRLQGNTGARERYGLWLTLLGSLMMSTE